MRCELCLQRIIRGEILRRFAGLVAERDIGTASDQEIGGSHVGLAFNRKAYRAIARALAAPEMK